MNDIIQEHKVKDGTFIPKVDYEIPEFPDESVRHPKKVRTVSIDENYPFLDTSFKARALHVGITFGIKTLVRFLSKIRFDLRIEGKEHLRKNKKLLKNGAMTICNHVHRWDYCFCLMATGHGRHYFPAKSANLETSDHLIIRGAGGIPIPNTIKAMHKFNEAFDEIASEKKWIHFFPEVACWSYYEPIRPFKLGAFKMAYKYGYPIVPLAIFYREPCGLRKLFGIKHPFITIKIGEVIPTNNTEHISKNEFCKKLRIKTHQTICALAGIERNCWNAEGD
ncbi:MAG: 1-acyl-sn-glycerol-3-phosphate acyltransferase [Bacteroides sp.]|nr:1-acyl-sn-glycerol-3-phosphate acyltransferase [Prevotella sp.]MCM1406867.1 1-acyl-sn-glycerol-3-phosphate acyltransferase [Treponema brennaborense]MCM1470896.1 1-acyl-sn-glycerol-3-phosphate acyltransferase [Bacteroides sp.]